MLGGGGGKLLSGEARDGDSEEECFEVGLKERVFARGRNGTGQRHAQREGRTREWLGKETGDKARGPSSALSFPHFRSLSRSLWDQTC